MPEQVDWEEFLRRFKWKQGEHLTAIGHTGAGKTTLTNALISQRDWVIFLATKKKDSTVDELIKREGFKEITTADKMLSKMHRRLVLKPKHYPHARATAYEQWRQFHDALSYAYGAGSWTVVCDEIRYLTKNLKLSLELETLWLQGRSLGITVVAGTQRPKMIPLEAYSQPTHIFFWRERDKRNLERIGEIDSGELDKKAAMAEVAALPMHDFLYVNTRTGVRLQSRTPEP